MAAIRGPADDHLAVNRDDALKPELGGGGQELAVRETSEPDLRDNGDFVTREERA